MDDRENAPAAPFDTDQPAAEPGVVPAADVEPPDPDELDQDAAEGEAEGGAPAH